ncbi:hypothetical protein ACFFSW_24725 [Saccharothrix longispora]|uniref:RDD family protein n=1 Tax=Saccharothrix longispora TaxID=33920 RepID=A0ABU1PXB6_9PSEU|nr:hypothetical protein [Saccharothrix longispora]MDR6595276.1 hypothetical protein [Saccharothrix longispora]
MTQPDPALGTHNTVNAPVHGPSVQAGSIHGDVHFHVGHGPPYAAAPLYPTPSPHPAAPRHHPVAARRAPAAGSLLGRWAKALLPLFLACVVVGGTVDGVIGPGRLWVKLVLDAVVVALAVTGVGAWSRLSGTGFRAGLSTALDRCTPRLLAAQPPHRLGTALCLLSGTAAFGVVQETRQAAQAEPGASGALLLLFALMLLCARLLLSRNGGRPAP